jgi:hypothetical protein
VLIAHNAIDEETYLRALATQLDTVFEPLDGVPRAMCPLKDERLIDSVTQGMLPLVIADELCLAVAPHMAKLMKTSRAQVDRLLDPDNGSATIDSLQRAARIVGYDLRMQLV